jgi:hypothetical protein
MIGLLYWLGWLYLALLTAAAACLAFLGRAADHDGSSTRGL